MAGHNAMVAKGLSVASFGTGNAVRLPGPSPDRPNVYTFGTPYNDIYNDLVRKDKNFYTQNGLLGMLDRNRKLKTAPERFHESRDMFDVIITCEARCWDSVVEELHTRGGTYNIPVHVINFEIRDDAENAEIGAKQMTRLTDMLAKCNDLESEMEDILNVFANDSTMKIMHTVAYY
jgi:RNA polymerase II subunit A C-terminal domain phosphatase SSU72